MRGRCRNQRRPEYGRYGGRGIRVSDAFETFEAFLAHVGYRPEGTSLDRIDNNRGYEPGNVRWATKRTQMLNRSDNRLITHHGQTLTLTEWSEKTGIAIGTLWRRLHIQRSQPPELFVSTRTASEAGRLGSDARWKK